MDKFIDNLELDFAKWLEKPEPEEDAVKPIQVGGKVKFFPPMGKVQPAMKRTISTNEMAATGVVFDPKIKPKAHQDWNYEGAAGNTGSSPKEWPIGYKPKGKKRDK